MNEHINGTPPGPDQHWSIEEAARRLCMTEERLARLIASGTIKTVKRGPLGTRVTEAEILRLKSSEAQQSQHRSRGLLVPGLGEKESAVLLALWTAAGPLSISEFPQSGPEKASASTTLRALEKLLAAGLVSRARREQHPHAWLYCAALSPSEYAERLARQVAEAVSQARTAPALAAEARDGV